jgi:hypothetical protein
VSRKHCGAGSAENFLARMIGLGEEHLDLFSSEAIWRNLLLGELLSLRRKYTIAKAFSNLKTIQQTDLEDL